MLTWQNAGDPTTPDTITAVVGLMPTRIGYTSGFGVTAFSASNTEITETTGIGYTPRGLSYFDSTGAQQLVFTIANKIYRYPGNTDVSRGVAYTNGAFSFAQYRDCIYGVNGADLLQKSTTGAFADVANTPKLTRIAVNGEYMAGINLVANYTLASAAVVSASAYRIMISAVGNPEQFDYSVDTTAYTQDIVNTGGPLTAIASLRDMFVVFQKSGVYVVESTGNTANPWVIRLVSDYFGCEWPDSVIEVNNILYWISPTRGGEVCAFDGSTISVLSGALSNCLVATDGVQNSGFVSAGSLIARRGGLVAATDGETIAWTRYYYTDGANEFNGLGTSYAMLTMNIPTSRFGYQWSGIIADQPLMVFSNAPQSGMLGIIVTKRSSGDNRFKIASVGQSANAGGSIQFFRGGEEMTKITGVTLRFAETVQNLALNGTTPMTLSMGFMSQASTSAYPAYAGTPTLSWMSTKNTGDAISKTESTVLTLPTGTWNSNTSSFDISAATSRSQNAKVFAFYIQNLSPTNSLVGITVHGEPSGLTKVDGRRTTWQ